MPNFSKRILPERTVAWTASALLMALGAAVEVGWAHHIAALKAFL